jgi:16S rRNA (guanine527-N7)-methyltransferase
LAFSPLLPEPPGRALDLGSGGGVPGLVLACELPGWRWALLDVARRRASFLASAVAELGLAGRVVVLRARAEELAHDAAHRGAYDVVTARSFAPPPVTAEIGAAFLRRGGRLLVAEPPEDPGRWDPSLLVRLGLEDGGATVAPAVRTLIRCGDVPGDLPRSTVFRRPLG